MNEEEQLKLKEFFLQEVTDPDIAIQLGAIRRTILLSESLGVESTHNFILPLLETIAAETCSDELMVSIAEQLKNLTPLVGGVQNTVKLLHILTNFSSTDETLVRKAVVDAILTITSEYDVEMLKDHVLPFISGLAGKDWAFGKWMALLIIAGTYSKFDHESQNEIRKILIACFHDNDNPVVRKAASECLESLADQIEKEILLKEFVPILDLLLEDTVDSVLSTCVPLCVAIGGQLNKEEVDEHIKKNLSALRAQGSWKIDYVLASHIGNLLRISEGSDYLQFIYNLYRELVYHKELEVQVAAIDNIFCFFKAVKENCEKDGRDFDQFFLQCASILDEVMFTFDTEVKIALSKQIILFGQIVSESTFKSRILPNLMHWIQTETKMTIQENVLLHMNNMPKCVDVCEIVQSLAMVIKSLILNSHLNWRTRRNLLLIFVYLAKYVDKKVFEEKFKIFYSRLIGDKIFAVRKSCALILPVLAKFYGIEWLSNTIVPHFMVLGKDKRYLYTYMPLFCINEMIFPSLDEQPTDGKPDKYLKDYKVRRGDAEIVQSLYKINRIFNKIKSRLEEDTFQKILTSNVVKYPVNSDINLYAEETYTVLKENYMENFYSLGDKLDCTYLEGILILIYRDFLNSVTYLFDAQVENLKVYSKHTLNNIKKFLERLNTEINQPWVKETIGQLTSEVTDKLNQEVEENLKKVVVVDEEEMELIEDTPSLPDLGNINIPEFEISSIDLDSTSFMDEADSEEKVEDEAMEVASPESAASKEDTVKVDDPVNILLATENSTSKTDEVLDVTPDSVEVSDGTIDNAKSDEDSVDNAETVEAEPKTSNSLKEESSSIETLVSETPGKENPDTETHGTETPGTETHGTETPGTDTHATETPSTETPSTDTPITETLSTETPSTNSPITETFSKESPSTETTNTETTTVEPSQGGDMIIDKDVIKNEDKPIDEICVKL